MKVVCIVSILTLVIPATASPAVEGSPQVEATRLVQAALRAEASGNATVRRELLHKALDEYPHSSLAHWSVGDVCHDGRWVSLQEVQREAASDRQLAEYAKLRDQLTNAPGDQLALARWCRDHKLPAEARIHWIHVFALQPNNKEAVSALGARWYHGQLLTEAQIKRAEESGIVQAYPPVLSRRWIDRWVAPVAKWRRMLKRGDAEAAQSLRCEVASAKDPRTIHALGTVVISGSRRKSDPKGFRLVSLELVDALDRCGEPCAAVQLARHAVEHPTAEVRNAAAEALKKRPKVSYVPWLLSQMQSPVDLCIILRPSPSGVGVTMHQTLEWEGADATYRDVCLRYYCAGTPRLYVRARQRTYETNIPQVVNKSWHDAANYAVAKRNQVDRLNAKADDLNQRIQDALYHATGETMICDPPSWRHWWFRYCCDYYELEPTVPNPYATSPSTPPYPNGYNPSSGKKPVVEQQHIYGTPVYPIVSVNFTSCFPANTIVWTLIGPIEIQRIKPGDRVLSQHPFTGELSFEPVVEVTRRKPSPMVEIGMGRETILATRGHPFWVCGEGWKMAKELVVGMYLHSVDGPILIDRLAEAPAARPWYDQPAAEPGDELSCNLILEQRHNYFVGRQKILVHDNTLFPADGPVPPVPGLVVPSATDRVDFTGRTTMSQPSRSD